MNPSNKQHLIHRGEGNISGVNMPLIPFNCIYDTDFGLLSLIYDEYLDPNVFDVEWFQKNHIIKDMVRSVYDRATPNPLLLCLKEKDSNLANELYQQFMMEKYEEILYRSMVTGIADLIFLSKTAGEATPTIVYRDKRELDIINQDSNLSKITKVTVKEAIRNMDMYQQFYFKSFQDVYLSELIDSDKLNTKTIYIARYPFNLDEKNETDNTIITLLLMKKNNVFSIDIYDRLKLAKGDS